MGVLGNSRDNIDDLSRMKNAVEKLLFDILIFFKDMITFVTTLLAFLTCMFIILNIFLGFAGADISVCIFTIIGVYFSFGPVCLYPLSLLAATLVSVQGKLRSLPKPIKLHNSFPKRMQQQEVLLL